MISWLKRLEIVECLELDWTWMHVWGCSKDRNPQTIAVVCRFANEVTKANWLQGSRRPMPLILDLPCSLSGGIYISKSLKIPMLGCMLQVASSVYHFQLTGCKSGLTGGIAAQQSVYATTLLLSEIAPVFLCFDMMWVSSVLKRCCMLLPIHFRDSYCVNTSLLIIILLVAAADASL